MIPESASARRRDVAPAVLRVVLWMSAFAGLFAMHGLNDHGVSHEAAGHGPVVAAASASGDAHVLSAGPSVDINDAGGPGLEFVTPQGSSPSGLAALCLAVLMTVLLLVALAGRPPRMVGVGRASPGKLGAAVRPGRERDPPCHIRLSILRC